MGSFRLFRRIKIAPGVTVNVSKSGLSTSFGPRGAKVTIGKRGIRKTVGLPGTGMYYTSVSKPASSRVDAVATTSGGSRRWLWIVIGIVLVAALANSALGSGKGGPAPSFAPAGLGVVAGASVAAATSVPDASSTDVPEPSDAPAAAVPTALAVKVKSRTETVSRGDKATVSVRTSPKAKCSIEVDYASGPSKAAGLGDKTASATGDATWSWTVSSRTTRGTWPVSVTCGLGDRTGKAETSVTVR